MPRSTRRPSSAHTLYLALDLLGAAPKPDPELRPDGPKRTDAPLLLGILLATTELDATTRADPGQEPPRGLTQFLTGYHATTTSPHDETRLRLLSHRLIRTAFETTTDQDAGLLANAAGDAALAAAGLIDAERLQRAKAHPASIRAALKAATDSLNAASTAITAHKTQPRPSRTRTARQPR